MWRATIITLYPELFPGPLGASVLGRGLAAGAWALETVALRDFADTAYGSVDDTPAGGGPGLVLRADIAAAALDSVVREDRPRAALTPRGRRFVQADAEALAAGPGLVLLCGRFEGIDQRVIEARGLDEISLGDFVLAGGEIAAMAVVEACVRLLPGVVGAPDSLGEESFSRGRGAGAGGVSTSAVGPRLLEYPHYTRPRVFEGREIPPVLLSGDHRKITAWRRAMSEAATRARRPDLLPAQEDAAPPAGAEGPLRRDDNEKKDGPR